MQKKSSYNYKHSSDTSHVHEKYYKPLKISIRQARTKLWKAKIINRLIHIGGIGPIW